MAYDEQLAVRLRTMLADEPVVEKRMFGGLGFMLGGHLAVSASGQGGLLVRVDPAHTDALLREPGATVFEMSGRGAMTGWLRVTGAPLDDDDTLAAWVERGLDYARTLPPK
ncbi:MAG TPA: TfoX/Sxy family protein [Mycobacteriales bacterium]|nr:TfoX/Sxy family protein [Mycobacteriales bacterium]